MSVRIGTQVGKSSWVSMGPIGWLFVIFVFGGLALGLVGLFLAWPYLVITAIFGHSIIVSVIGWIATGMYLIAITSAAVKRNRARQLTANVKKAL